MKLRQATAFFCRLSHHHDYFSFRGYCLGNYLVLDKKTGSATLPKRHESRPKKSGYCTANDVVARHGSRHSMDLSSGVGRGNLGLISDRPAKASFQPAVSSM